MFRIAYCSTLDSGVGEAEIASIARRSAEKNAQAGLTGVWLLSGRRCLSAIEGDPRVVRHVIEEIWDDPRHSAFSLLEMGSCESALFPWPFRLIRQQTVDEEPALLDHEGLQWLIGLDGADAFFHRRESAGSQSQASASSSTAKR